MKPISTSHRSLVAKTLFVIGGIGMLVGALDPLEGSLLILAQRHFHDTRSAE